MSTVIEKISVALPRQMVAEVKGAVETGEFVEGDLEEIRERFRVIAANPAIFRLRPEIGEDAPFLSPHGRYVILFRIDNDVVRVERVTCGGRELASLFGETG